MFEKRIGLVANDSKAGASDLVKAIRDRFLGLGWEVVLEMRTRNLLQELEEDGVEIRELGQRVGLVLVVGGDGTLLQAVQDMGKDLPKVCGINLGSLGFLTAFPAVEWRVAVDAIASGRVWLSWRTLLQVELVGDGSAGGGGRQKVWRALNDAVLSRGELSRLVRLEVRINGEYFSEYGADGLIVSTPTGSTAYSLSAGGPVLMPESGVHLITPICPHVLTMRPMIVPEHAVIEIGAARSQEDLFLTIDGQQAVRIEPGQRVRVTRTEERLGLVMLEGTSFFGVLRQKLKLSGTAL
jgi:NAD+ kinase